MRANIRVRANNYRGIFLSQLPNRVTVGIFLPQLSNRVTVGIFLPQFPNRVTVGIFLPQFLNRVTVGIFSLSTSKSCNGGYFFSLNFRIV